MKRLLLLAGLVLPACDAGPPTDAGAADPAALNTIVPGEGGQSRAPDLVARPADQAELDRLILAGYTPHGEHLHAPGVKSCPLSKGNDAVM